MYLLTASDFSVSLCINATFNEDACAKQGSVQIKHRPASFTILTPQLSICKMSQRLVGFGQKFDQD